MIGNAVRVMEIATGQREEDADDGKDKAAQALGRKGGKARAEKMTPERRAEIAKRRRPKNDGVALEQLTLSLFHVTFVTEKRDRAAMTSIIYDAPRDIERISR